MPAEGETVPFVQVEATACIREIVAANSLFEKMVMDAQVLPMLIKMLGPAESPLEGDPDVQLQVLGLLAFFAEKRDENRKQIGRLDGVLPLVLLLDTDNVELHEQLVILLKNLAINSVLEEAIMSRDAVTILLKKMRD